MTVQAQPVAVGYQEGARHGTARHGTASRKHLDRWDTGVAEGWGPHLGTPGHTWAHLGMPEVSVTRPEFREARLAPR